MATYVLVAVAAQMYAGNGESGVGLGNPDTADYVFAALAGPVLGSGLGIALFVAVLASSASSLQTMFIPAARTLLAMSVYRAFPGEALARPRALSRSRATRARVRDRDRDLHTR